MIKLKTKIISETKNAVFLEVVSDEKSQLIGKQIWLPKSQLSICDPEITISVTEWMYNEKVNDPYTKSKRNTSRQCRNRRGSKPNNRSNNTNQASQERNSE
jgi:hypothetical protein